MRLWSIHPQYLDPQGLVALWRETLLAKKVLEGKTKGYREHPQLLRFKAAKDPVKSINYYLQEIHGESVKRGYRFDAGKIEWKKCVGKIPVTSGQIKYERDHLLKKLHKRSLKQYEKLKDVANFKLHPVFKLVEGDVEKWEKV
jgi:hypothetical protein